MKKAFTLIELLVVVLIIGILSAIALPQYQKAVHKARFAEVLVRAKSYRDAINLYMLENPGAPSAEVKLADVYPDLVAGLTKQGSYYYSKYTRLDMFERRTNGMGVFQMSYLDGDGSTILELGYDKNISGEEYFYCYYEDDGIGKSLCTPLAAEGYDVSYGL